MDRSKDRNAISDMQGARTTQAENSSEGSKHKHALHLKEKGLRRPKQPLSFQASSALRESAAHASTTTTTPDVESLEKRVLLLGLVVRRNKNQHRNQLFFKHVCLLRASLTRLLGIFIKLEDVANEGVKASSSEQVRLRFEKQAGLRSQKEVLEEHIREALVSKCYASFSGLVADSQFASLGVVLVGLLSEIAAGAGGVGLMKTQTVEESVKRGKVGTGSTPTVSRRGSDEVGPWGFLLGTSTKITGEDQGEVIERTYGSTGEVVRRSTGEPKNFEDTFYGFSSPAEQKVSDVSTKATVELKEMDPDVRVEYAAPPSESNGVSVKKTDKASKDKKSRTSKKQKSALDDLFSGLL